MINFLNKLIAIILLLIVALLICLLCLIQPFVLFIAALCAVFFSERVAGKWGINVLEGFDNSQSASLGGDPDETVSSRLGKAQNAGSGWRYLAWVVDYVAFHLFGQTEHSKKAIEKDEGSDKVTHY